MKMQSFTMFDSDDGSETIEELRVEISRLKEELSLVRHARRREKVQAIKQQTEDLHLDLLYRKPQFNFKVQMAKEAIEVPQPVIDEENNSSERHQNSDRFDKDAESEKETEADDNHDDDHCTGDGDTNTEEISFETDNDPEERVENSACVDNNAESGKETETDDSSRDDPTGDDGNTINSDSSLGSGATEERVKNDSKWLYAKTRPDQRSRKDRNLTRGWADLIQNDRDTKNTNPIPARRKKKQTRTIRENANLQVYSLLHDLFRALVLALVLGLAPSVVVSSNVETVWTHSGDNVTIDCPLHRNVSAAASPSASVVSTVHVRMESKSLPFYSQNHFIPGGTKTESQTSRFDISESSEYIRLTITEAQNEDEDTYHFIKVVHTGDNREQHQCYRPLVVLTPPGKAKCDVLIDPDDSNMVVHCNASIANSEAQLFCFQGSSVVLPDYHYVDETGRSIRASFRVKNSGEHIRCCSKARLGPYSVSAQLENCHDYSWSATTPASTYVQDGKVPSATSVKVEGDDAAPIEKTTPTSSSSSVCFSFSRMGHVPSVVLLICLIVVHYVLMLG